MNYEISLFTFDKIKKMNDKLIIKALRISISLIILASLFKLMHWPFANVIIISGLGGIVFFYPFRFFFKEEKRTIDYVKLVFLISFPINAYLMLFHLPTPSLLPIISFGAFVLWIALELNDFYNNKEQSGTIKTFPFGILSIIVLFLFMGAFYKLMHFPYANVIVITGFTFLTLYFLIIYLKKRS